MKKINISIRGMHCQSCVTLITQKLEKMEGIKNVNVNFATEKAAIEFNESKIDENSIIKVIASLGYKAEIATELNADKEEFKRKKEIKKLKNILALSLIF